MLRRKGLTIIYSVYVGKISKALEDSSYDVVKDVFVHASINEEGENECIKQSLNQDLTYI